MASTVSNSNSSLVASQVNVSELLLAVDAETSSRRWVLLGASSVINVALGILIFEIAPLAAILVLAFGLGSMGYVVYHLTYYQDVPIHLGIIRGHLSDLTRERLNNRADFSRILEGLSDEERHDLLMLYTDVALGRRGRV